MSVSASDGPAQNSTAPNVSVQNFTAQNITAQNITAQRGPLAVEIDPAHGARLVSFRVAGEELLSTQRRPGEPESLTRGCYPMVPWAGRIGGGEIMFGGMRHQLPVDAAGHALHGTGRDAAWQQVGDLTFDVVLGAPWPVEGRATLQYELTDHSLLSTLTWDGAGPGASLGFHPWFRRHLSDGTPAELSMHPLRMVERGPDHLPTGHVVPPSLPPWDDCFTIADRPTIRWGERVALQLRSDAPWWVAFTEPEHALCVEPQTAPPDAFHHPAWHDTLRARSLAVRWDVSVR